MWPGVGVAVRFSRGGAGGRGYWDGWREKSEEPAGCSVSLSPGCSRREGDGRAASLSTRSATRRTGSAVLVVVNNGCNDDVVVAGSVVAPCPAVLSFSRRGGRLRAIKRHERFTGITASAGYLGNQRRRPASLPYQRSSQRFRAEVMRVFSEPDCLRKLDSRQVENIPFRRFQPHIPSYKLLPHQN